MVLLGYVVAVKLLTLHTTVIVKEYVFEYVYAVAWFLTVHTPFAA